MGNHQRIATGTTAIPLQTRPKNGGLSATELAVCREVGISPEAYREANQAVTPVGERSEANCGLSESELAVCRAAGVSPEAFRKSSREAERTRVDQGLSEAELAVCRSMGLSAEAFHKANQGLGSAQELEALISEGERDGRIAGPATAAWLRQQGLAACREHLTKVSSATAVEHGLSGEELAVCRRMALDPEAYRRTKMLSG